MKVHLRKRKQSKSGIVSLYLEYYKGTTIGPDGKVKGMRDYEYLDLYLIEKPRSATDKQKNKEALQLAETIKAKREIEIKNGYYGFSSNVGQNANFIEYFRNQTQQRYQSLGNFGNWDSVLKLLIKYKGENVLFKEVDAIFCEGFKNFLINVVSTSSGRKLSSSSVSSYLCKLRACLKTAVKERVIQFNPCDEVSGPKVIESKREYLTIDELKALVVAECRYDFLKRAFLFSCLTGLRWSDIQKLQWSEVSKTDDGWRITFHQQKTKGLQYLDISDQAREYLGVFGAPEERVFIGLKYSDYMNVALARWMLSANITKKITFHCARHTHAVILLSEGVELYTVSQLLGHANIKTTEIYAQIIDSKKKEAVNKIPDIRI